MPIYTGNIPKTTDSITQSAIAVRPKKERQMFDLFTCQEQTQAEAAAVLQVTQITVRRLGAFLTGDRSG